MEEIFALKDEGDQLFAQGYYERAIECYDRAIGLRPQFWEAYFEKGRALYELGEYIPAAASFSVASLFGRRHIAPQLMCARSLTMSDLTEEACYAFGQIPYEKIDETSRVFYAKALQLEGRHEDAEAVLPGAPPADAAAPWFRIQSTLSENQGDFATAEEYLVKLKEHGVWSQFDLESLAGLKGKKKDVSEATSILHASIVNLLSGETPPESAQAESKPFDTKSALQVLSTIFDCLGPLREHVFVAFGTLLGLYREGALLGHDKDMDIGVLPGLSHEDIKAVFEPLAQFTVLPTDDDRAPYNIVVKHVSTGIVCDFFFFSNIGQYFEGGLFHPIAPITWSFSEFDIVEHELGGVKVPVPDNPERHLEEVYGPGWTEPEPLFDTVVHGFNLNESSRPTRYLFAYMRLHKALRSGKFDKAAMYAHYLIEEHGEEHFVPLEQKMRTRELRPN